MCIIIPVERRFLFWVGKAWGGENDYVPTFLVAMGSAPFFFFSFLLSVP
jgi:hypothetical protein